MAGLTQNYITPFAIMMLATTQQIGYLSSVLGFVNMLAQLIAPYIAERAGSRKSLVLPAVVVQAVMWLPVLAIPFVFQTNRVWWLIAFMAISTAAGSVAGPAWSGMMADLLPPELRGRYLGSRNRFNGLLTLIFSFVAGGLLQVLTSNTSLAFAVIFSGAFVARLVSVYYLSLMNEPHPNIPLPSKREGIPQIAKAIFATNVGRFMIFTLFLNMSVNIGSPFFSAYMLRELKINYISYQIINAASMVTTLSIVSWWGIHADKAGSLKIMRITAAMIPFVPMLWLVGKSVWWMATVQVYSGFIWAGFNLCAGLFVFDAAPQENRVRYIALYGAFGAIGTMAGSLIGGNLGPHLPQIAGSYFLTLFLLSGILRLTTVLVLLRLVNEVREVPQTSTAEILFSGLRPAVVAARTQTLINRFQFKLRRRFGKWK